MNYIDFCMEPLKDPIIRQLSHRLDLPYYELKRDLENRLKQHYFETEAHGLTPNIVDYQHVLAKWEAYWKKRAK